MKPHLKNYKVTGSTPLVFTDLVSVLAVKKAIYFAPLKRVMPTRFFLCWSWGEALTTRAAEGCFWEIEKYDDIMRKRIRESLKDAVI